MLANRLDRIRWRQFVLARVNQIHLKSGGERQRKYLSVMRRNKLADMKYTSFLKVMRRNERAIQVTFVVLQPNVNYHHETSTFEFLIPTQILVIQCALRQKLALQSNPLNLNKTHITMCVNMRIKILRFFFFYIKIVVNSG